jgi:hypothetical protein
MGQPYTFERYKNESAFNPTTKSRNYRPGRGMKRGEKNDLITEGK